MVRRANVPVQKLRLGFMSTADQVVIGVTLRGDSGLGDGIVEGFIQVVGQWPLSAIWKSWTCRAVFVRVDRKLWTQ